MMMATERNDTAGYLGWFFLGGVIGAAAALLLTPRTGQQTREMLVEQGGEFARRAQEVATEAQGRAGEWLDKSRELFEEQTQRLMTAFEAGKDAMREETRKGPIPPRG
jgi:gas vesicle protein